jgi:Domain of unknown function (DUF4386)
MDDKKWAKLAVLGGVGFVILNVVGAIMQGALPMADDTNEEVLEWFTDNESGIRTAGFLGALSIILLLWWFGTLWRRMATAETNQNRLSVISLVGLTGSGALFGAQAAVLSTVALKVEEVGPEGARFFYTLSSVLIAMAGAFVVAHLVATNMLALRTGFLPKWNAMLGFLPAVLFLISTSGTMTDEDLPMITGGIGFITWSIWILATSFNMWKTAD